MVEGESIKDRKDQWKTEDWKGVGWDGGKGTSKNTRSQSKGHSEKQSRNTMDRGAGRSQSLCARAMRPRCRPPRKRSHLETPRGLGPAARARAALRLALQGGCLCRGRPWIWCSRSLRSLAGGFAPLLAPRDGEAGEGVERGC